MKRILFLGMLMLTLVTCRENSTQGHKTIMGGKQNNNENIKVIIEGIFQKNDVFQVYYNLGDGFSASNYEQKLIFGSPEMQKVVFILPEKTKPKEIMITLGQNKKQENITLKNISIKYKNDSINGDEGIFQKYFDLGDCISYDNENFVYRLNIVNNEYNPFIIGNKEFNTKLVKLYRPTAKKE